MNFAEYYLKILKSYGKKPWNIINILLTKYDFIPWSTEVPGSMTTGTVDGLQEGKEYKFQVKAGCSEPSTVSPAVKLTRCYFIPLGHWGPRQHD